MGAKKGLLWIAGAILILSLTGCHAVPAVGDNPASGGTLTVGILREPESLNPLLWRSDDGVDIGGLIFSGLFRRDDQGEYRPDLAAAIPTAENGGVSYAGDSTTVTYRIRPDGRWHDGEALTAADVEFTYFCLTDSSLNPTPRPEYAAITGVVCPDPYTVRVTFRGQAGDYLALFDRILPQHLLAETTDLTREAFNRKPVGTGPFTLAEWHPRDRLVLRDSPDYYGGRPALDTIVFRLAPDRLTLSTQLKTGQIDLAPDSGLPEGGIDAAYGIKLVPVVLPAWDGLVLNLRQPLLQDLRVRQAILAALDRPGLAVTYAGQAVAAGPGLAPAADTMATDAERARAILETAGWVAGADGVYARNGIRLRLNVLVNATEPWQSTVLSVMAGQMLAAGIELVPVAADNSIYAARLAAHDYAAVLMRQPDRTMALFRWHSLSADNYSGYRNVRVDALLDDMRRSEDPARQNELAGEIHSLLAADLPVLPLVALVSQDAVSERLENYRPYAADRLWNVAEWRIRPCW